MYKSIENPMSEIFKYLAISILFMFIGFIFGQMFVPISFAYYANKIFILLVIGLLIMSIFSRKNIIPRSFSMNFVYMFTFIDGIIIYPLLQYYLQDLGKDVFISILVATIVLFTVLAKLASRKDAGYYLGLGNILFAGLIGILIASIINIFIGGNALSIVVSIIGVVIFSGYVLYDISLIKYEIENGDIKEKNDLSIHVLNLYLDFINLLLDLLNISSILND
ncbi:hypothetical protein HF520_08225 [Romboutsia sp. CE17]|uniref:Bax inhibitor-1/YccA family protein n=1 Tax=Romboutsia sp. CE17 TaxID=2724150 RepID=UPI001442B24E|nr:Bax inhibitor-1 family protein [Romboutsia sp. CE17]QJA08935.1 hypothetical protein HF520_08225 [Romboutsia sp. CE17]